MALNFRKHAIVLDWNERAMEIRSGRQVAFMVRYHELMFAPDAAADEAVLKSVIAKVNADQFLDCEPGLLLCTNSGWRIDVEWPADFLSPPQERRDSDKHRPNYDMTPGEWVVVLHEMAQTGWNQVYRPAEDGAGGKLLRVEVDNYAAVDFEAALGTVG